jgi:hypothetical protein
VGIDLMKEGSMSAMTLLPGDAGVFAVYPLICATATKVSNSTADSSNFLLTCSAKHANNQYNMNQEGC